MTEELKVIISAEVGKLKTAVAEGKKKISEFVKEGTKDFGALNEEFQKVGDKAKTGLKVAGGAIAGVTTALLALVPATAEYRQQQAQLISAFETVGGSAETAKNTFNDLYRVLGDAGTATEASQQLANITTSEKELEEYTKICQGVYAKWGSAIDSAGFAEGINHTIQLGEVQGTLADALEWTGISVDDFNAKLAECNTEAEREKLIRETLGDLYNESAENYEKNASGMLAYNEAQLKMQEATAKIGEVMQPILAMFIDLGANILSQLTPIIAEFAEKHLPTVKSVLDGVAEAIGAVIGWISDNWELVSTLATIILGIATALTVVSTAMGVVNAVMAISPVTLIVMGIVTAIALLTAGVVLLIKHWDTIKATFVKAFEKVMEFLQPAIDKIKEWFSTMTSAIVGYFSMAWENIKIAWDVVVSYFQTIWKNIKLVFSVVKDVLTGNFSGAWDGIKEVFANTKKFFSDLWGSIKQVFANIDTFFSNTFGEAWTAVKNAFSSVGTFFNGLINTIIDKFKDIGGKVADTISGVVRGAINKVLSTAVTIINGFITSINFAIGIINAIPGVSIAKLSKLQVPQLEEGGVLKKGQIGLLEGNGAEAVVPLEKNTEWINKVASQFNAVMGNGTPIVLQIDGKTFAQLTVSSINDLTRQTGKLQLAMI